LTNGYAHDQKSNYTFVDGHVESLGFYSTLQTSAGIATESDVTGSMWDATR
jgi:prepilin-type processing-associated H-X9-DG protein